MRGAGLHDAQRENTGLYEANPETGERGCEQSGSEQTRSHPTGQEGKSVATVFTSSPQLIKSEGVEILKSCESEAAARVCADLTGAGPRRRTVGVVLSLMRASSYAEPLRLESMSSPRRVSAVKRTHGGYPQPERSQIKSRGHHPRSQAARRRSCSILPSRNPFCRGISLSAPGACHRFGQNQHHLLYPLVEPRPLWPAHKDLRGEPSPLSQESLPPDPPQG